MRDRLLPDPKLRLTTPRLVLEPILESHAPEMLPLLSAPELYRFIPQDPLPLEKTRRQVLFLDAAHLSRGR